MARIDVHDLVLAGLAYRPGGNDPRTGVDCFWLHREIQARAGRSIPGWESWRLLTTSDLARFIASSAAGVWERLSPGAPLELLDALITCSDRQPHVYTVTNDSPFEVVTIGSETGIHPKAVQDIEYDYALRLRNFAPCTRASR